MGYSRKKINVIINQTILKTQTFKNVKKIIELRDKIF